MVEDPIIQSRGASPSAFASLLAPELIAAGGPVLLSEEKAWETHIRILQTWGVVGSI